MKHIGVVIADRGSAIVHVEHEGDELLTTAIERLPFSLTTVADRVQELDNDLMDVMFAIDAAGLGAALWTLLGPPTDEERWQLYAARGVERQALVDRLLVAVHEGRFHFAPNLPEQQAMTKALQAYRRQVREDGLIGSELVVALLLALIPPKPHVESYFAWRPSPFGPPAEADGTLVGGVRLRRGRGGQLVGFVEQEPRP